MSDAQRRRQKLFPIFQVSVSGEKESETQHALILTLLLLSQVVGMGLRVHARVHVCGPALVCMPVWLTH